MYQVNHHNRNNQNPLYFVKFERKNYDKKFKSRKLSNNFYYNILLKYYYCGKNK